MPSSLSCADLLALSGAAEMVTFELIYQYRKNRRNFIFILKFSDEAADFSTCLYAQVLPEKLHYAIVEEADSVLICKTI